MSKGLKKAPVANPLMVLREEFDDWAVLFDPDSGKGYGLNPVSCYIFKKLDGKHTEKDILEGIRENFNNVPGEAKDHLSNFIAELVEQGFAGYRVK